MISVRELIKEATSRANIVPRRQAVPGNLVEIAFNHLKGIVSKYNNDNLLAFTQENITLPLKEKIHIFDENDSLLGPYDKVFDGVDELNAYELTKDDVDNGTLAIVREDGYENAYWFAIRVGTQSGPVYTWSGGHIPENVPYRLQKMIDYRNMYQMYCPDVSKINTLTMIKMNEQNIPWTYELNFMPYDKFERCGPSDPVFTFVGKAEGEWIIQVKPMAVRQIGFKMKLNYNRALDFDIDDDLMVPDNYTELLITALTHKLALQFPRLDDAQMQRLENDLRVMVDNVRTPKADVRQVLRNMDYHGRGTMTQWELESGNWIFGG